MVSGPVNIAWAQVLQLPLIPRILVIVLSLLLSDVKVLEMSKALRLESIARGGSDITFDRPGFWRQFTTLLKRDATVAIRDPTLYYLQVR